MLICIEKPQSAQILEARYRKMPRHRIKSTCVKAEIMQGAEENFQNTIISIYSEIREDASSLKQEQDTIQKEHLKNQKEFLKLPIRQQK